MKTLLIPAVLTAALGLGACQKKVEDTAPAAEANATGAASGMDNAAAAPAGVDMNGQPTANGAMTDQAGMAGGAAPAAGAVATGAGASSGGASTGSAGSGGAGHSGVDNNDNGISDKEDKRR